MKQLMTPSEVIDAIGGNATVARIASTSGETFSAKRVWNWRKTGLPPKTYVVLKAALEKEGYTAPASLWGMIPANEQSAPRRRKA